MSHEIAQLKISHIDSVVKFNDHLKNKLNGQKEALTKEQTKKLLTPNQKRKAEILRAQKEKFISLVNSRIDEKMPKNKKPDKTHQHGEIHLIIGDNALINDNSAAMYIPGEQIAKQLLNGDNFEEVSVLTGGALKRNPKLFKTAGELVPLVKGAPEFIKKTNEEETKITIITTKPEPFINGLIQQTGAHDKKNINIFAVRPDTVNSIAKREVFLDVALNNWENGNNEAIVFIGGAKSDTQIINPVTKKIIGTTYARKGTDFEKNIQNGGGNIRHKNFKTFAEITDVIKRPSAI